MKRIITLTIAIFIIGVIYSQNQVTNSPFNPKFIRYINELDSGKIKNITAGGHKFGYMPSPFMLNFDTYNNAPIMLGGPAPTMPSIYDMRKGIGTCGPNGLVTPVEDQLFMQ